MLKTLAIIGMHRSGTSLVAQACSEAGISAGPEAELLSAQADNPEGFYENRRLVELNDALIAESGGSWFSPPSILVADATLLDAQSKLLEHLGSASESSQLLLKDPRLCLTWEQWARFAVAPTLLYVYRSPLAVARSLARRNRFSLQYGLLLWEIYNRRAVSLLAPTSIRVSYDQIASGESSLSDLLNGLRDRGFHCDSESGSEVFRRELRHFESAADDADWCLLSDSQRTLHDHCVALCSGQPGELPQLGNDDVLYQRAKDHASSQAPLARLVETTNERNEAQALSMDRLRDRDRALAAFKQLESDHLALVEAHNKERERHALAAQTLENVTHDHADLAKAHAEEQKLHLQAAQTLNALTDDHSKLAAAHEREVSAHADLLSAHADLLSAHNKLHKEFDERGVLQQELYTSIASLEKRLSSLKADHAVLTEKTEYLFFSLTESYKTLLLFETSTLARVQSWARRAYRLLTWQRGKNSAYEDLLAQAHVHFDEFSIDKPSPQPTKLRMAMDVLRYVRKNPAGSARSFSWQRLRRAASVFFGSSSDDLAVWVDARFPDTAQSTPAFDPDSLSPDLDSLELDFPTVDRPLVSIVVPVYNDYRVTVNCLQSVHRFSQGIALEVIVADDSSTDLTATIAERIRGITVSTTSENLRFLKNCNQAAEYARGEYIVFLNNDTAVTEGWLASLLEPFKDKAVGVTGPMLLFADGVLQEAGGIIWSDASGWNFGRSDDRSKPAYSYRRDVDYVSGACLAIRGDLWRQLEGFDERFAPAYYEDADLCFSARTAGYRVVYQPQSVVYHFEGVSNGTDLNAGVKQHQVSNQAVFREKWQQELQLRHFANAEHVIHARDRSSNKPCVLVIDHYVPHHDKDAGGRSTYMYVKLLLSLGCRVQLMGANFFPHQPYTKAFQAMGVEVLVGESIARNLDAWLADHAPYIDEVFLHRPHIAEQMLPHLERMSPRPRISFFGHDLHYLRIEREAALKNDESLRRDSESWRKRELAVCEASDRVYYFSQVEVDALSEFVDPTKLRRIPLYAMEVNALPGYTPEFPMDLLFVGGYNHPPNVDAAVWLVQDILPSVLESVPGAHLHLVGSNAPADVLALASENVIVHGYVSDEALDELYRQVGLVVVPLRFGAGIKGKIIEAIANHVPVVTTDIGVEGIPECESVMWVENTAATMADTIVSLLLERELTTEKLDRHERWLQTYFDREVAATTLRADIPALGYPVSYRS